ncbi:MAG: BrnT family toxin [Caldilineaceae bacterium]
MRFEWDQHKNTENIHKRNLDFGDAHHVFQRPMLRMLDDRKDYGEDHWIGIGMLDSIRIVVVVFTELDENTIRIISMRKALAHEQKRYQQAFKDEFGTF